MKCDICDEDFANSEEVKLHKERVHPLDERKSDEELESPDRMDTEPERPEPIVRPAR
ncbi:MAG TPA: hypothetical protein VJT78_02345 [Candidatus Dormibacteraeota bacterium]|nr:hypothetical protein [Candidatus Dormibacteraeota bacterium]